MTDKAKERVQRACQHTILLRIRLDEQYQDAWQCADCLWVMELARVLEESAT